MQYLTSLFLRKRSLKIDVCYISFSRTFVHYEIATWIPFQKFLDSKVTSDWRQDLKNSARKR